VYVPGGTDPDADLAPPVAKFSRSSGTLITKSVGAGPVSAVCHKTDSVRPSRYAKNCVGVKGDPLHVVGNVTVTAFDDGPVPPAFVAATDSA
jgi:hypothetical protein